MQHKTTSKEAVYITPKMRREFRKDPAKEEAFLTSQVRLIYSIVKNKFAWAWDVKRPGVHGERYISFLDCVSEGVSGLLIAYERYDYARGVTFSTYATWWIKQTIRRAIEDHSENCVRVPVWVGGRVRRYEKAVGLNGEECLVDEEREEFDRLQTALRSARSPLRYTQESAGGLPILPMVEDRRAKSPWMEAASRDLSGIVQGVLERVCSEREQDILRYRFMVDESEHMTLKELGTKHSLSRERIRQIQEDCLDRMRVEFEKQGLTAEMN